MVPRLWPGEACAIIGGGPTVPVDKLPRLQGARVIAVNSAFSFVPWAGVHYYGDYTWPLLPFGDGRTNREALLDLFGGLKYTGCRMDDCKEIQYITNTGDREAPLQKDPHRIGRNRSAGGAALNIAYHLGVKKIILFGFDLRAIECNGEVRPHFHNQYEKKTARSLALLPKAYETMVYGFQRVAPALKAAGVEVFNASPGSALDCFPVVSIEDGLTAVTRALP